MTEFDVFFIVISKKHVSNELLTLIDRRFSRHLPIQPDYSGRQVDAINEEKVKVNWAEFEGEDSVYLINN